MSGGASEEHSHQFPAAADPEPVELEETLDILSDPKLMRRIRKAKVEVAAGNVKELTKHEALALVKRQR